MMLNKILFNDFDSMSLSSLDLDIKHIKLTKEGQIDRKTDRQIKHDNTKRKTERN